MKNNLKSTVKNSRERISSILLFSVIGYLVFTSGCESSGTTTGARLLDGNGGGSNNSVAGSTARFIIVDSTLYTVDSRTLRIFSLSNGKASPRGTFEVGFDIETLFSANNTLFIGSSTGVYFYNIIVREKPEFISKYEHIFSCDPVVADLQFAYATLSTGRTGCWRGQNRLDVIDISNLVSPRLVTSVPLASPRGLGLLSSSRLVVCDGLIRLLDVSNKQNIRVLSTLSSLESNDVIPFSDMFVAINPKGILNISAANDSLRIIGQLLY